MSVQPVMICIFVCPSSPQTSSLPVECKEYVTYGVFFPFPSYNRYIECREMAWMLI